MTASGAGGHSKQEHTFERHAILCYNEAVTAFESMSKILALRPAVVSGRDGVSPVSTKVIIGLHNIKLESCFPNIDSPMSEW